MALSEGTRALIKEMAREVIAENHKHLKAEMATEIKLHAAQCSAKKYANGKNFISAIVGGGLVAFWTWFLRRL